MPEGDTIHRAAAALRAALVDEQMVRFEAPRLVGITPRAGRLIESVESHGKHLEIEWDDGVILHTHMRMSGSWHLYRPGEAWQRPAHQMRVRIDTDTWVAVAFNVPVAEFLRSSDLPRNRALASLGPDFLAPVFDRDEALRRLAAAGPRPIAAALLDQRVVAGIGNVFKSEVLFLCGIHPDRPADMVTDAERASIVDTAVPLMRSNTGPGAVAAIVTYRGLRRTTRQAHGAENLWVYGRAGKPCRRCGTPIESEKRGLEARPTYWCPRCQPSIR